MAITQTSRNFKPIVGSGGINPSDIVKGDLVLDLNGRVLTKDDSGNVVTIADRTSLNEGGTLSFTPIDGIKDFNLQNSGFIGYLIIMFPDTAPKSGLYTKFATYIDIHIDYNGESFALYLSGRYENNGWIACTAKRIVNTISNGDYRRVRFIRENGSNRHGFALGVHWSRWFENPTIRVRDCLVNQGTLDDWLTGWDFRIHNKNLNNQVNGFTYTVDLTRTPV